MVARKMQNKKLGAVLIELSTFFNELCSKVATPEDFKRMQDRVIVTLYELERIFLPSFFDIMVHLVVHLPYEAMVTGPVVYHWMYPIERDLKTFKWFVRNKAHPEESIAEGYLATECLTFCARYLHGVETKENRSSRNNDDGADVAFRLSVFSLKWKTSSRKEEFMPNHTFIEQAHSYVLFSFEELDIYEKDHYSILSREHGGRQDIVDDVHRKLFPTWFSKNVSKHLPSDLSLCDDLKYLSAFPSIHVRKMPKLACNRYKWCIKDIDNRSVTQNSGVLVKSVTSVGDITWFGILTGIFDLVYPLGRSVILFQCDWVDPIKGIKQDVHGLKLVNLKARYKTNEPFILASQAMQVFYTPESKEKNWHVAIATKPRDLFEMDVDNILGVDLMQASHTSPLDGEEMIDVRDDVVGVTVDVPLLDASGMDDDGSRLYVDSSESDDEDEILYDYDED